MIASRILVTNLDHKHNLICSGYLVEDGRVLLVHHNGFDKWVPPGGHIEAVELFPDTVAREFKEETGLEVEVLSAQGSLSHTDDNATPVATPFYADYEREGFAVPALVQFYWVRRISGTLSAQLEEVSAVRWFTKDELKTLNTFEQVQTLATYALDHHPSAVQDSP